MVHTACDDAAIELHAQNAPVSPPPPLARVTWRCAHVLRLRPPHISHQAWRRRACSLTWSPRDASELQCPRRTPLPTAPGVPTAGFGFARACVHAMDDDDNSPRLLAAPRHHELESLGVSRERFLQLLVFAAACLLTAVNWNILVR